MTTLITLSRKQLRYIPKDVLIKLCGTLHFVYKDLPEAMQNDPDILMNSPCLEHYNLPSSGDHIDGPPPSKKCCYVCKKKEGVNNI